MPVAQYPPREFDKHSYPIYVIEPPDILLVSDDERSSRSTTGKASNAGSMDGLLTLAYTARCGLPA